MSSDASDERLERIVRRAVRAELTLLAERLFWTFVAALGLFWGIFLVFAGLNGAGDTAILLSIFGVALFGAAVRTLLLKWELPPYRPTPQ